jgi:hypothetical protein
MTLAFNWAESDYVSAYWAWLRRRPWKIALGFWYSLFILGMVVVGAIRNPQNWRTQVVGIGIALGAGAIGYVRARWGLHRYFKKSLLPDGPVTARVDDGGVSLNVHGAGKSLSWTECSRFHESSKVVVLEKGENEYIFLPKSAMSDTQVRELRGLAASGRDHYRQNITERPKAPADVVESAITCVDDVPALARVAARQRFLMRSYQAVGLAPFAVALVIVFGFFPNSNNPILDVLVGASLIWTLAVVTYTVYLSFAVRCPVCKNRFGIADNCRSCNLPRHCNSSGPFRTNS